MTRLVLVNAIYFKGYWNMKFEIEYTWEADFHISPTEKVKVQMMNMREATGMRYGENRELKCKAIELWYKDKALSMFVVLPDHKVTSLEEMERKLTADHLTNIDTSFTMCGNREPTIWLPRFKLEETLKLKDLLKKMGMNDMFTEGVADFSGMDGSRELYVDKAIHKAVVEVNEEGTEAAATTVMTMRCCSGTETEYAEFRADRPFLFFIRDNKTKIILFIGRVTRP